MTLTILESWRTLSVSARTLLLSLFAGLLLVDGIFLVLHTLRSGLGNTAYSGFLLDPRFSIEQDGGYSEFYEHLKVAGTVAALGALYSYRRALAFLSWGLVFTFVLLDNALELHERLGALLVSGVRAATLVGLRPQDVGEVAVWAVSGAALLSLVALSYRERANRAFTRHLLALFALLVAFGLGVDVLHSLGNARAPFLLGFIEDGGELVTLSLILSYVLFALAVQKRQRASGRTPGQ